MALTFHALIPEAIMQLTTKHGIDTNTRAKTFTQISTKSETNTFPRVAKFLSAADKLIML